MEKAVRQMPKKNLLSSQIDLSKFEKATEEEKRQQDVMSESTTFFKDGMKRLMKNPLAVGSMIFLILVILVIIFAPMIVPYDYATINTVNGVRDKGAKNMGPFQYSEMEQEYMAQGGTVFPHIMGTDEQCRDYFMRVVYGTRVSLSVGRSCHDAYRGYYLLSAGFADGNPVIRCLAGYAGFGAGGNGTGKTGHEYHRFICSIRSVILGGHGTSGEGADSDYQE